MRRPWHRYVKRWRRCDHHAALLAGAGGQTVVVGEPDRERRRRRLPAEATTLWCLAPDGTPAWTWQPPGPLTGTPTISGDVLYVTADGRLFGLSLQDSSSASSDSRSTTA